MSRSFLLSVANSVAQRPCPPPPHHRTTPPPGARSAVQNDEPPGTPPPKEVPLYHALFECIRRGFSFGGGGDRTEPFRPRCPSPASSPNRAGVGVVGVNTHLQQCSLGVACGERLIFLTSFCWSAHLHQRPPHVLVEARSHAADVERRTGLQDGTHDTLLGPSQVRLRHGVPTHRGWSHPPAIFLQNDCGDVLPAENDVGVICKRERRK